MIKNLLVFITAIITALSSGVAISKVLNKSEPVIHQNPTQGTALNPDTLIISPSVIGNKPVKQNIITKDPTRVTTQIDHKENDNLKENEKHELELKDE